MSLSGWKTEGQKYRRIISDFSYNIIAMMIVTIILQIVVYPFLAGNFSAEEYGQLLTIMGIANIFVVSLGGGLNNVRLIRQNMYEEQNVTGDFNLLLFIFSCIGTIIFAVIVMFQFQVTGIAFALLLLYVFLGIVINYWSVAYRIVINYKANLIYNLFLGVGYLLGIFLAKKTGNWVLAFAIGEVLGLLYLLKSIALHKERIKLTLLFSKTLKAYLVLIGTNFVANVVTYLDRIFLYPIIGGEQVTIYTVSSFIGKSIGLVITPVAGVLLSYYSQKSFTMTVKKYWKINGITFLAGGIIGGVAILVAPFITGILYPTVIEAARPYLIIANVASLVGALTNILAPSVLKFSNILWQIVLQLVYAVVYIGAGYILMQSMGLMGFCIATLLVNLIRMMILMAVGHFSIWRNL